MSTLNCVTTAVLHPPPAVNSVHVRRTTYRERPAIYVADPSHAQDSPARGEGTGLHSPSTSTGTQRSPSLPQFSARFPVKKAQHGGRFDSVDLALAASGGSSAAARSPLRRSQQTVRDLMSMNTNDHVQRSMQKQGSAILSLGVESKDDIVGRPIFPGSERQPPPVTAIGVHSFSKMHANSPNLSPRDAAGSQSSAIAGVKLPRRPHTALPRPPPPLTVDLAPASPAAAAAAAAPTPMPPDGSHTANPSSAVASPASCSQPAERAAASPLPSARSARPASAKAALSPVHGERREVYQLGPQNFPDLAQNSALPHDQTQAAPPSNPAAVLSVPSSYCTAFRDNVARFENIVPAWSARRSHRPLSSKSESSKPSGSPAMRQRVTDAQFDTMRCAAAGILEIPLWKFEQQGSSAITDTGFRLNHGRVLKSPRSRQRAPAQESGFLPLHVESSNTHGASLTRPVSAGAGIDIHKSKTTSPDGKTLNVFRIGERTVANSAVAAGAASAVVAAAANDAPVAASPRVGGGRVVLVELPSGSDLNPSARPLATAVQVAAEQAAKSLYFEVAPASVPAISNPSSIKVFSSGRVASICGSPKESPRTVWRQQYRLASDAIQLNSDSWQGKGLSSSKVRPSTAPSHRSFSHEAALQAASHPVAPAVAPHETAASAVVKGHSVLVNSQRASARGDVDVVVAVVPAPRVL